MIKAGQMNLIHLIILNLKNEGGYSYLHENTVNSIIAFVGWAERIIISVIQRTGLHSAPMPLS